MEVSFDALMGPVRFIFVKRDREEGGIGRGVLETRRKPGFFVLALSPHGASLL